MKLPLPGLGITEISPSRVNSLGALSWAKEGVTLVSRHSPSLSFSLVKWRQGHMPLRCGEEPVSTMQEWMCMQSWVSRHFSGKTPVGVIRQRREHGEGEGRGARQSCAQSAPLLGGKTTRPVLCFSRPVSPSVL